MRIVIFAPEDRLKRVIAEAWGRAFRQAGNEVTLCWHATQLSAFAQFEMAFEIGARIVKENIGCPILHWLPDPVDAFPPDWHSAYKRGHLFFFADFDSAVKAHQQGIRTAEYLPFGWDSNVPYEPLGGEVPDALVQEFNEIICGNNGNETGRAGDISRSVEYKHDFDFGHFGNPTPAIMATFQQIKALGEKQGREYKIAVWGIHEQWRETEYSKNYQGEILFEVTEKTGSELMRTMDRCRYVIADPRFKRPDPMFMLAGATKAVALCAYSADMYEMFMQSEFMYAPGKIDILIPSINDSSRYSSIKLSQYNTWGTRSRPHNLRPTEYEPCGNGRNRLIDRVAYLFSLMTAKQLFENAKPACKPMASTIIQVSTDAEYIKIGFPKNGVRDNWNIDISDSIQPEAAPTILRRAARRLELQLIDAIPDEQCTVTHGSASQDRAV